MHAVGRGDHARRHELGRRRRHEPGPLRDASELDDGSEVLEDVAHRCLVAGNLGRFKGPVVRQPDDGRRVRAGGGVGRAQVEPTGGPRQRRVVGKRPGAPAGIRARGDARGHGRRGRVRRTGVARQNRRRADSDDRQQRRRDREGPARRPVVAPGGHRGRVVQRASGQVGGRHRLGLRRQGLAEPGFEVHGHRSISLRSAPRAR
jgi:hypothetical protein